MLDIPPVACPLVHRKRVENETTSANSSCSRLPRCRRHPVLWNYCISSVRVWLVDRLSADGGGTDRWHTIDKDALPVNPAWVRIQY